MRIRICRWPYPYRMAVGMNDDTDSSTVPVLLALYEYCIQRNVFPTKTVWIKPPESGCGTSEKNALDPGTTLRDPEYRAYCLSLARRGVVFGLHGVSSGNNTRESTLAGIDEFRQIFGYGARLYISHSRNAENPYWGPGLFNDPLMRRLSHRYFAPDSFHGHDPSSKYYWGDICRKEVHYVRLFRTLELDVLRRNPHMPYHDFRRPDVRFWFSASAQDSDLFGRLDDRSLERIACNDGAMLIYMHATNLCNVADDGQATLLPVVRRGIDAIASRSDCWRPDVISILDRLLAVKNVRWRRARHGIVIENPSSFPLDDFQFETDVPQLWDSSGQSFARDSNGRMHIPRLDARSSIPLYFSPEEASIDDAAGISRYEMARMKLEEMRHILWQMARWDRDGLRRMLFRFRRPFTARHQASIQPPIQYPRQGSNNLQDSTGKQRNPQAGGAKSGALGGRGDEDADLAALIQVWPTLTPDVKRSILALAAIPRTLEP